jgi:hypothetical protein
LLRSLPENNCSLHQDTIPAPSNTQLQPKVITTTEFFAGMRAIMADMRKDQSEFLAKFSADTSAILRQSSEKLQKKLDLLNEDLMSL